MRSPLRGVLILGLGVALGATPLRAQNVEEVVIPVTAEGTDCFRQSLYDREIEPLSNSREAFAKPSETIFIFLGGESVRKHLTFEVAQAVREGATLLIASDRNSATSQLQPLFGIRITGELVRADPDDCYQDNRNWPHVRPKNLPWIKAPKDSPHAFFQELKPSGPNALATNYSSVLFRTFLSTGEMTPLEPLAGYPRSARYERRGELDQARDLFAVGGKWGNGHVLVLADDTVFSNAFVLAEDVGNLRFSEDVLDWLSKAGDGERKRCLFVENGKVQEEFQLFDPRQIPWWIKFDITVRAIEEMMPELEKQRIIDDFFQKVLLGEGITNRILMRAILLLISVLFVLFALFRLINSRVRRDPARILVTPELAAVIPRGGVLRQRIDNQWEVDNLYEEARRHLREGFTAIGVSENAPAMLPVIRVSKKHPNPRGLQKVLMRLWEIAYGVIPTKVSPEFWHRLLDNLDHIIADYEEGWWWFVAAEESSKVPEVQENP